MHNPDTYDVYGDEGIPEIDSDTAKDLWSAVVKLSILDLAKGPGQSSAQQQNFSAARLWLWSDAHVPTSFVWVCENMGWSPQAIRRRLGDKLRGR